MAEPKKLIDTIDMWIRLTKAELKKFTYANIQMDERDISDLMEIKGIMESQTELIEELGIAREQIKKLHQVIQALIHPDDDLVEKLDEFIFGVESRRIKILDSPMKIQKDWLHVFNKIRKLLQSRQPTK